MIFDILESKLIAAGFTAGTDLFRGTIPADTSIGVMMRSSLTGFRVDPEIPHYYKGEIQVITRHVSPGEGSAMADRVMRKLTMQAGSESYPATGDRGAVMIKRFVPQSLPIEYPRLTGNGFELSQTWDVVFTMQPLLP